MPCAPVPQEGKGVRVQRLCIRVWRLHTETVSRLNKRSPLDREECPGLMPRVVEGTFYKPSIKNKQVQ